MSIIKDIPLIKDKIIYLLENHPHLRSNDKKLLANVWYSEAPKNVSVKGFLKLLSEGKLTNAESIRRCRQKVQEQFPHLRGDNYKLRQEEKEVVRSKISKV